MLAKQLAVSPGESIEEVEVNPQNPSLALRELLFSTNLSHPHIAQATDFSFTDNLRLVFPEGTPISRLRGLTLDQILGFFSPIACALQAMHKAGYGHANVNPDSILLVDWRPKLADLFSVTSLDADPRTTWSRVGYYNPRAPWLESVAQHDIHAFLMSLLVIIFNNFLRLPLDMEIAAAAQDDASFLVSRALNGNNETNLTPQQWQEVDAQTNGFITKVDQLIEKTMNNETTWQDVQEMLSTGFKRDPQTQDCAELEVGPELHDLVNVYDWVNSPSRWQGYDEVVKKIKDFSCAPGKGNFSSLCNNPKDVRQTLMKLTDAQRKLLVRTLSDQKAPSGQLKNLLGSDYLAHNYSPQNLILIKALADQIKYNTPPGAAWAYLDINYPAQ